MPAFELRLNNAQAALRAADWERGPSLALGISTVREANAHYVSQWGPTPWNSAGAPYGYKDCGPTCGVIALSARGRLDHPSPARASAAIHEMRNLTRGHPTEMSGPTYYDMLLRGLRSAGAQAWGIDPQLRAVNEALGRNDVVLLAGDPRYAWGEGAAQRGNYLADFKSVPRFDHWIAVLGRTDLGGYVVADPLSRIGAAIRPPEALRRFWADARLGAAAIEVD